MASTSENAYGVYCPGHAGVKGNDLTSGLLLERSEVLRSLRHYLRAQSQGHRTIDRLEERGVERGSARRSSLKGRERAIVNQTNIGTVAKAMLGKLVRDGVERLWALPIAYIYTHTYTTLNSTELIYRNVCICSLRHSSSPQVFRFHGRGTDIAVSPNINLPICLTHSCKVGSCKEQTCTALHFCMFFLLSGKCDFKDRCLFGHDLNTDHNRRLLQDHLLGGLNMTELRTLFCLPWVRRGVTVPRVCR